MGEEAGTFRTNQESSQSTQLAKTDRGVCKPRVCRTHTHPAPGPTTVAGPGAKKTLRALSGPVVRANRAEFVSRPGCCLSRLWSDSSSSKTGGFGLSDMLAKEGVSGKASLIDDSVSEGHLTRPFPAAKAGAAGDPDSSSARASK